MNLLNINKRIEEEKRKRFGEKVKKAGEEINKVLEAHNLMMRPIITKYGGELEFQEKPEVSEIIKDPPTLKK